MSAPKLIGLLVASVQDLVGGEVAVDLFLLTPLTRLLLLAFQLGRCARRTSLRNACAGWCVRGSLPFAAALVDVVAGSMPLEKIARLSVSSKLCVSGVSRSGDTIGGRLTLSQSSYCIPGTEMVSP